MEARTNDWWRRGVRTIIQLIAGGGLTALFQQVATDLDAQYTAYVLMLSTFLVTVAQNYCEDQGWIPAVLKSKPSAGQNPVPDPAA